MTLAALTLKSSALAVLLSKFDSKVMHVSGAYPCSGVVSALSVAPSCKITVTGYDEQGKGVANQQFEFLSTGLKNEMAYVTLDGRFRRLSRVEFTTSSTLNVLTALLLDDIQYTTFAK